MAFIVYQTNKKTGKTYAYSQEAYRDPETKKPRSRKTYLGRVDPITKEIIGKAPGNKRNRTRLAEDPGKDAGLPDEVREAIEKQKATIISLREKNEQLAKEKKELEKALQSIRAIIDGAMP